MVEILFNFNGTLLKEIPVPSGTCTGVFCTGIRFQIAAAKGDLFAFRSLLNYENNFSTILGDHAAQEFITLP